MNMSPQSHHVGLLFTPLLLLALHPPFASPLSFNYSNFFADVTSSCSKDIESICLQGDATVDQHGVLQLTRYAPTTEGTYSTGRAFYSQPLHLWDKATGIVTNFTTKFSFIITNGGKEIGDGIAFSLSYYPSKLPKQSYGGQLGLTSVTNAFNASGNLSYIAVEFDTFSNTWDPSSYHIGIDVNSLESVTYQNLTGTGFGATDIGEAQIQYESKTRILSVSLDYNGTRYALPYVVDLKLVLPEWVMIGISGTTGEVGEFNQILSWSFEPSLQDPSESHKNTTNTNTGVLKGDSSKSIPGGNAAGKKKKNVVPMILIGVGLSLIVNFALCFVIWTVCTRMSKKVPVQEEHGGDALMEMEVEEAGVPRRFTFDNLATATGQFNDEKKLGWGGSGVVYKGFVRELNRAVAVKRISDNSDQGRKEYMAEVKTISRLRHRNLVQFLGWCHERGEFLLVYEFMPKGSLDQHLFRGDPVLPWRERYHIAVGVASALFYLHEEWDQCVVHRDIKSSNIMLDDVFNAKLGDFGLARMADHGSGLRTTMLAGTIAYMAPEVYVNSKASKESDVYSFGIVALEIACGRKAIEHKEEESNMRLVEIVWDLYGKGRILEAADQRLHMEFDERQMERLMVVGLWCAYPDHTHRPSIMQALGALKFEEGTLELPRRMAVPRLGAYDLDVSSINGSSVRTFDSHESQAH